jgi:hypothetical protein
MYDFPILGRPLDLGWAAAMAEAALLPGSDPRDIRLKYQQK